MTDLAQLLTQLESGTEYRFCDWPNPAVPQVAAGVYTIWRSAELVYVGMAGRSLTADNVAEHRAAAAKGKGLSSRLGSHAAGRRSGDQFCVYVADRLVLSSLSPTDVQQIERGQRSMDPLVRVFIHQHLSYRFVEVHDGTEARTVEAAIRKGALQAGRPLLNPSKGDRTSQASMS